MYTLAIGNYESLFVVEDVKVCMGRKGFVVEQPNVAKKEYLVRCVLTF